LNRAYFHKEIQMSTISHALSWFEIPVTNFVRAQAFYETLLGKTIEPMVIKSVFTRCIEPRITCE
jgi:predicted enzyme related to lactoylglutathione lyase